jgi:hypothetical protein
MDFWKSRLRLTRTLRGRALFEVEDKTSVLELDWPTGMCTACISVPPAISRDLCRPRAVDICSVRKGTMMTRRRGAGPYPNAKQMMANNGVRRIVAGINSRI